MKTETFEPVSLDVITFEPASSLEFDDQFRLIKQGIGDFVDVIWGWNDDAQRQRIQEHHPQSGYHWLTYQGQRVGLVCYHPYDKNLHVHMLVIKKRYQAMGIGREVMNRLECHAPQVSCNAITLSCFSDNHAAVRFYRALGFHTVKTEPHFINFRKNLGR